MDVHLDTSWCPVCNRQIAPTKYTVDVPVDQPHLHPPPPAQPNVQPPPTAAPPASPAASPTRPPIVHRKTFRGPNGGARRGGGLVHGMGRVKANGMVKRSNTSKSAEELANELARLGLAPLAPVQQQPPPPPPPPPPPVQMKQKTVVDPAPTPLYCSDACRVLDSYAHNNIPFTHDPERDVLEHDASILINSLPKEKERRGSGNSDDTVSSASTLFSVATSSVMSSDRSTASSRSQRDIFDEIPYNPSVNPFSIRPAPTHARPAAEVEADMLRAEAAKYEGGLILTARRIVATFTQPPRPSPSISFAVATPTFAATSSTFTTALPSRASTTSAPGKFSSSLPTTIPMYETNPLARKEVPGWTDGSNAWRAEVYGSKIPDAACPVIGEPERWTEEERGERWKRERGEGRVAVSLRIGMGEPRRDAALGQGTMGIGGVESTVSLRGPTSAVPRSAPAMRFGASSRSTDRTTTSSDVTGEQPTSPTTSYSSHRSKDKGKEKESKGRNLRDGQSIPIVKPGAEARLLVADVKLRPRQTPQNDSYLRLKSAGGREREVLSFHPPPSAHTRSWSSSARTPTSAWSGGAREDEEALSAKVKERAKVEEESTLLSARSFRELEARLATTHIHTRRRPRPRSTLSLMGRTQSHGPPYSRVVEEEGEGESEDVMVEPREDLRIRRGKKAETRSWSYDNVQTYPLMPLPPAHERRVERVWVPSGQPVDAVPCTDPAAVVVHTASAVDLPSMTASNEAPHPDVAQTTSGSNANAQAKADDGRWVEREVVVEVYPERKRLFLFPSAGKK